MAAGAEVLDIAREVTRIVRLVGRNFTLPIYSGAVAPGTVEKGAADAPHTASPVTIADIGVQILMARELARIAPGELLFGEEYIPEFDAASRRIIDAFQIGEPLSPRRTDARDFLALLHELIASGNTLPKAALDSYRPLRGRSWLIDPIDGTIYFTARQPRYVIQLACVENGRVSAGWLYRPVQDQMFYRIGEGPAQLVTFAPNGTERVVRLALSDVRTLTAMTVVYPYAHLQNPHDDVTAPLYLRDGQRIPHEVLMTRTGDTFPAVRNTEGYSHSVTELFLGNVHAVATPGTCPWDHFGAAHIARGAGYRVAFIDGQSYLGISGEIPFTVDAEGQLIVRRSGGLVYAPPAMWDDVNRCLHLAHHPLGADLMHPSRVTPVLRR